MKLKKQMGAIKVGLKSLVQNARPDPGIHFLRS
ncbi:hypothetical protein PRUB_a6019 [Pseudoalteromonas rubra]|uniref:Uncharacterized protein n=1 Tax=Pseudoalteromonas rubra TaxID=43658 RepID=A0A8T0C2D9_9GAMM|nr:hypothetical protein PRUB_a6019 [Pseudoalteromonas rubra]